MVRKRNPRNKLALYRANNYVITRLLCSKKALIATSWDRSYFFIQGGNLMCQSKEEVAGGLVMDLNEDGTVAEASEVDDRRNVFTIVQPVNKK